jgi:uncharacterized Zn finger protein (UPF0148 family)
VDKCKKCGGMLVEKGKKVLCVNCDKDTKGKKGSKGKKGGKK